MSIPEPFAHQRRITEHLLKHPRSLIFSDPGTGKTRATLDAILERRRNGGGRALVIAPKAILLPAWVADCHQFTPRLTITAAFAPADNRRAAFTSRADVVVTNHDAATWLTKHSELLDEFDTLVIDESTAYKNPSSQRTKAVASLVNRFEHRCALTGTPAPNGLLDLWSQVNLIDDGERLGKRYYAFRSATHEPRPIYRDLTEWVERPGAWEAVADLISDITVRLKLEDCIDMPICHQSPYYFDLPVRLRKYYDEMQRHMLIELEAGLITAVHAGAKVQKLSQIASGAVYDGEHHAQLLDTHRYELIAELCAQRDTSLVGFLWKHQRDGIITALKTRGIDRYAVIDGENNEHTARCIERFQEGAYQVLLAHPKSAGHGLTLTRARTLIWASPTWNAELDEQLSRRIYRIGQTQRTEIIRIIARGTIDERIQQDRGGKSTRQTNLLNLLHQLKPLAA